MPGERLELIGDQWHIPKFAGGESSPRAASGPGRRNEHMVGEVTCRMLAMAGYQSDSVTTGREALSLLDDGRPINAAIIDICLPDLLGTTVGEALLEGHPDARIVFTSAYPEIRSAPPERPGTIFLAKPYTVEELLAVVGRILPLERARD